MNVDDYIKKKKEDFIKYKRQGTYTCYFSDIDYNKFSFYYVNKNKIAYIIEFVFKSDKEYLTIKERGRLIQFGSLTWEPYKSGPVTQMIEQMDGLIWAKGKCDDN